MEQISTRVIMIGAASVLGVALVAGGAYAAHGSLTVADAPGKVLQVSGVGSASALADPTTTARTNPSAEGGSSATTAHPTAPATTDATSQATAIPQSGVKQVAPPAPKMLPTRHAEIHSPEPAHSSSHM
ncbi:MAG TPA: hypothetical protein VFF32_06485 [Dermatophilaceae bacterium]|nr:hypothetical protein [Dermatophilaceae bacterium]